MKDYKMIDICFLILHYKNYEDTARCINSILILDNIENCKILILDNGSCNNSFKKLEGSFKDHKNIILYKWEQGGGFSRGNNFLYQEAQKFSPSFIIAANNDIVFCERDFNTKLKSFYSTNPFDILGPDIYIPDSKLHQNPMAPYFPTFEYLEAELEEQKRIRKHIYTYILKEWLVLMEKKLTNHLPAKLHDTYQKIRFIIKPGRQNQNPKRDYTRLQYNCVLCGACLVFSPSFIKKNEKLFDPETDFYYEEYLLGLRCQKTHMLMLYNPHFKVEHNHGASTRYAYKNLLKKRIFITDNMIKSGELLLSVLKEDNHT